MRFSALANGTLAVTAIAYGLIGTVVSYVPMFGPLMRYFVVLSLSRYCYEALRHFAQGHVHIPAPDMNSVNPFGRWSLLLHFVTFPAAIICVLLYLSPGVLFGGLLAVAFPASAGLMAVTGRLESAFSPFAMGRVIAILGRDYVLLAALCLLVTLGAAGLAEMLAADAGPVSLVLATTLEAWGMLAVFALIGSALHVHRLDFDIPGERPDTHERELAERERAWRAILDQAYASLRGGRPESGYRTLRQFLEEQGDSADAYYWLVENMFDWEDKRHALGVAARLIRIEIERGRVGNAMELYRRCRRYSDNLPIQPADAAALAAFAESIGQQGRASELAALARATVGASEN